MRGIGTFTISLLAVAAFGQTDYFPLDVGNQWIYRTSALGGSNTWQLKVTGATTHNGREYAIVDGYPGGPRWFRKTEDSKLYGYDPQTGLESLWYDFAAPEKERWRTGDDVCNPSAFISSKATDYRGPVGEFNNALTVNYPPEGCADAGLTQEAFLPSVGLVSQTSTTIAGPRRFDLIYAKLGTSTIISEPAIAFTLTIDKPVYQVNVASASAIDTIPVLTARMTLRNSNPDPVELEFASGQTFEFVIKNEAGKEAYRWSDGQGFIQVIRTQRFTGETNWSLATGLRNPDRTALPAGKYVAEAWLVTPGNRDYHSSVRFEIRQTR